MILGLVVYMQSQKILGGLITSIDRRNGITEDSTIDIDGSGMCVYV